MNSPDIFYTNPELIKLHCLWTPTSLAGLEADLRAGRMFRPTHIAHLTLRYLEKKLITIKFMTKLFGRNIETLFPLLRDFFS